MGTYVYKISRKSRKVKNLPNSQTDVYEADFAFKVNGYDDSDEHRKTVGPTERAWDKYLEANFPMKISSVLFAFDFVDGSEVWSRDSVSWYDGVEAGRLVGYLRQSGYKRFRFEAAKQKNFEVTIPAYEHTKKDALVLAVSATCARSAIEQACKMFRDSDDYDHLYKDRPAFCTAERVQTTVEGLHKAMDAVKRDQSIDLSERIDVRNAINQAIANTKFCERNRV